MADDPGGQAATTFTQAQVEEMVRERVDATTAGLRAKRDELLGKLAHVKEFDGLDPVKARAAIAALEQAEADKAKALGDWDANESRLRKLWADEHTKVVAPLQERLAAREAQLFDAVAGRDAMEAMTTKEVDAYPLIALPLIRHELGVETVEGRLVTVIKGQDGKPRYHPTTGALVTPKDRLLELKTIADYAGAFKGTGASGGGAAPGVPITSGAVTLTPEQAGNAATFREALKQVGGDYSKVLVKA